MVIHPALKRDLGEVSTTFVPRKLKPVEEYLACQERFAHLFRPVRQEAVLGEIQERVDERWRERKEQEQ